MDVMLGYQGTNSVDAQGPTPGVAGGSWLTLDSPLEPFRNFQDASKALTSHDVVNIEKIGYTYEVPSHLLDPGPVSPCPILATSGVNRGAVAGSFV